ncbi:hypothetical protein Tco_1361952 [Tanacetum coccineum]
MDQDSAHIGAASKVPMLEPDEYELWRMRMKQYIQMIDYSLWEVIENGNSAPKTKLVEGVETVITPTTAEEKAQRSTHFDTEPDMFRVHDGNEVFVETEEPVVNAATTTSTISVSAAKDIFDVDMTLAQALAELKTAKPKDVTTAATTTTTTVTRPKAKGIVIQEQEQASKPIPYSKDKGKGIMDDIQAKIDADHQLAEQLQAQEQEELTDVEKATLFVQLLEKRRKHFAAKRAEEKRNRPPIKAQQRSIMCTYLKNMDGWKPKDLKNKSFAKIQELFDKAMKRVNTFVDFRTDLWKKVLRKQNSKKQKVDEDKESEELKKYLEIVPDDGDGVTIEATPLSIKTPTIVDYKIYKEGKKSFFQIIRADGNSQMYLTFTKMLKNFDREDLEVLWGIVKARFKKTEPVNYMDEFLLLNLKTMFKHHVEDSVWKEQQGLVKVLNWKLFYSCEVYCVTMQSISYYLLVEKKYPLTNHTPHQMFNDVKLQVDYECEMTYDLLILVKKQLKEGYGRIVGIKRLHDVLEVTAAKLMLLVYKLLLLVFRVNAAGTKLQLLTELQLLKDYNC